MKKIHFLLSWGLLSGGDKANQEAIKPEIVLWSQRIKTGTQHILKARNDKGSHKKWCLTVIVITWTGVRQGVCVARKEYKMSYTAELVWVYSLFL